MLGIRFDRVEVLWALAALPFLLLVARLVAARARRDRAAFAGAAVYPRLVEDEERRGGGFRAASIAVALAGLIVALAGPRYGFRWEEVKRRGADVVVALDVSRSMLADDVKPNRLDRAKRGIVDLLEYLKGDRVGLVVFAGDAFVQCPLTLDASAFRLFLDPAGPDLVPRGGSALETALRVAAGAFDDEAKDHRAIVLITDGESHEGDPIGFAKTLEEKGISIYALGIGEPDGALIPLAEEGRSSTFLKDKAGNVVKSSLDESTLRTIALETGGAYVRAGAGLGADIRALGERLAKVAKRDLASVREKRYESRHQWPLLAALAALALDVLLRPKGRFVRLSLAFARSKRAAAAALALALLAAAGAAQASPRRTNSAAAAKAREAERLEREGKSAEALARWREASVEDPRSPDIAFNAATAAYRAGELDEAAGAFERIMGSSEAEPPLRARAAYNLGNARYRKGEFEAALEAFEKAVDLDPSDEDARFNAEFIATKLDEERKKKEEQEEEKQKGEDEKKGEDGEPKEPGDKEDEESGEKGEPKEGEGDDDEKAPPDSEKGEEKPEPQDGEKQPAPSDEEEEKGEDGQDESKPAEPEEEKPGEKEEGKSAKPEPGDEKEPAPAEAKEGEGGEPKGQLTREQAMRFLDNLKEEEKNLLKNRALRLKSRPVRVEKDW